MIDNILFKIDDYLKTLNLRYVYCGSISLYLHGLNIKEIHDADIDFIDLSDNDKYYIYTNNYEYFPIDKMFDIGFPIEYEEIEYKGRIFLIDTLEYELKTKYKLLEIPNYRKKEKVLKRIEQIKEFINNS